jgi:polysaccharide biosynthesis transport protein
MSQLAGPTGVVEDQDVHSVAESEGSEGVSIGDIFRALLKNKWLILACTLICLCVSAVYVTIAKPVYEANATLRIDPGRAGSLGLNDLLSMVGSAGSGEELQTEMSIIKSDQVAMATLQSLPPEQFRAFAGFDKGNMSFDPANRQLSRQQENLLAGFEKSLTTKQVEGTQLIGIHFRSGNPEIASTIINHVIDAYTRGNFNSRYDSVDQVKVWLSKQMDELKLRASLAQQKLAQFQEQHNLVGTDPSNNTTIDRLKAFNERLTQAEGDRIVKEAQMRAAASGNPAVLASLLPDPKLQSLQQEEGTLYAQYVQLSAKFGPGYPPLEDVKKQLAKVELELGQDVSVVSDRLKEDFDASQRAEGMLRGQYENETAKAYALNRTQADYAVLLGEATSSRDLFDTLQYKLQQASVDAGLNSVNTMIVDRARAPIDPIEPKKGLILVFGLVLGLAVGVGAALLRESLSDHVQTLAEIERGTGLAGLATVPHVANAFTPAVADGDAAGKDGRRTLITFAEPRSRGAEAYRSLRNSVLLSSIDHPAKLVLITSSLPGEGKSSTAANYAIVLAQKGTRVLLVDADLRRPTLHLFFGLDNKVGLSDAILGAGSAVTVEMPIPELPDLHFLPAGEKVSLPSEALGSSKFQKMLHEWVQQYDIVLLDSAPILSVSDTVPAASWADSIILVVRAGVTPLKALQRTKSILKRAHVRISGVLLNDFSERTGEYGYYGKYDDGYYN